MLSDDNERAVSSFMPNDLAILPISVPAAAENWIFWLIMHTLFKVPASIAVASLFNLVKSSSSYPGKKLFISISRILSVEYSNICKLLRPFRCETESLSDHCVRMHRAY